MSTAAPPAPPPPPEPPKVWSLPPELEIEDEWKDKRHQKELQFLMVGAIENGNIELLTNLIKDGVNTNASIILVKYPIILAVDQPDINHSVVELLLNVPETDPNIREGTAWGVTALHTVAKKGCVDVAKLFLEGPQKSQCDVNVLDNGGASPLHFAAKYGHVAMVTYLISQSADVNIQDNSGRSALHRACEIQNIEIAEILINNGHVVDMRDKFKWTPIFHSVFFGHLEMVRFLIAQGARVDLFDIKGRSLLHTASYAEIYRSNWEPQPQEKFPVIVTIHTGFDFYERRTLIPPEALQAYIQTQNEKFIPPGCHGSYLELVKLLINTGADPKTYPPVGYNTRFDHRELARVTAYILLAGAALDDNNPWIFKDSNISQDIHTRQWFHRQYVDKHSLKRQCRYAIRRQLTDTRDIDSAVNMLPLPKLLKDYLNLEDFNTFC